MIEDTNGPDIPILGVHSHVLADDHPVGQRRETHAMLLAALALANVGK